MRLSPPLSNLDAATQFVPYIVGEGDTSSTRHDMGDTFFSDELTAYTELSEMVSDASMPGLESIDVPVEGVRQDVRRRITRVGPTVSCLLMSLNTNAESLSAGLNRAKLPKALMKIASKIEKAVLQALDSGSLPNDVLSYENAEATVVLLGELAANQFEIDTDSNVTVARMINKIRENLKLLGRAVGERILDMPRVITMVERMNAKYEEATRLGDFYHSELLAEIDFAEEGEQFVTTSDHMTPSLAEYDSFESFTKIAA